MGRSHQLSGARERGEEGYGRHPPIPAAKAAMPIAVGHPEKIVDFSYRAVHQMTVKAKAVDFSFSDRGPML